MIFAQDSSNFGTGEVLWSIFWFSLFFLWIWLVIRVFADIMRAKNLSGWAKALWTLGILVLPYLGVFLYLIVNGDDMNRRDLDDAQATDDAMRAYIRNAAGSSSPAEELATLASLHEAGRLSDEEYQQAKAKVMGA